MLHESLRKRCDEILRYGTIVSDQQFETRYGFIRVYSIKYENNIYEATKTNGEWTFLLKLD